MKIGIKHFDILDNEKKSTLNTPDELRGAALPKSAILMCPVRSRRIFSGLMSLCT